MLLELTAPYLIFLFLMISQWNTLQLSKCGDKNDAGFPFQGGRDKVVGNLIVKKVYREYKKRLSILTI